MLGTWGRGVRRNILSAFVWAAAAIGAVLALPLTARALNVPSITGVGLPSAPGDQNKRLSFFYGYAIGSDSNPNYLTDGSATDPVELDVVEQVYGLVYNGGNDHRRIELAFQGRANDYADNAAFNHSDGAAFLHLGSDSEKFDFGVKAKFSDLREPRDVTLVPSIDNVEWTEFGYAPYLSFGTGKSEFYLELPTTTVAYDDPAFDGLDLTDTAQSYEFRYWSGETKFWYAHADLGSVERVNAGGDYDYQRIYLGLTTETPRRSGMMLGVGMQSLSGFAPGTDDASPLYAIFRSGWVLGGGRSGLDFAAVYSSEPSATAACMDVLGLQLRFRNTATRFINWSVGARMEDSTLVSPTTPTLTDYGRLILDAQLNIEIGSPGRAHGRVYVTFVSEQRTASDASINYDRVRLLTGIALVK